MKNSSPRLLASGPAWRRPTLAACAAASAAFVATTAVQGSTLAAPVQCAVAGLAAFCAARWGARKQTASANRLANTDALTGLPNRSAFVAELQARCAQSDVPFGLLFMDLDRFKVLNDTVGHLAADSLLADLGAVIRATVPEDAYVARPGGDEFAIIVPISDGPASLRVLAQQLLARVAAPLDLQGKQASVTASIGIAAYPEHGATPTALLASADVAMYASKDAGRNGFRFFGSEASAAIDNFELERDLQGALAERQFVLHYQPLFDPRTERVVGVEALMRWMHPRKGLVPPNVFVPLLEKTGMIVEVGMWVIEEALGQLREWVNLGAGPLTMSINVSARQLQGNALTAKIHSQLHKHALAASQVQLELTETDLMANPAEAQRILAALQTLGVCVAIDDFGTGHSSLSYLTRFAPDTLKVDKSFIDHIDEDVAARIVVEGIIDLAHRLDLRVVAEGVERAGQLAVLRDAHCDEVQGFLLGRPAGAQMAFAAVQANQGARVVASV